MTPQGRLSLWVVFGVLLAAGLLFFHGELGSSDELQMALTTQSLIDARSLHWMTEYQGLRFSGYGIGTSLAAVPMYLLEKIVTLPDGLSFLPLTNTILFALLGVFLAAFRRDSRYRWTVVGILIASPFLAAATTLYSEMLSATALVGFVLVVWKSRESNAPKWIMLAALGAAFAILARLAMLPLVGLVGIWAILNGARKSVIVSSVLGAFGALAWTGVQNAVLRGSPFATGYEGQEFTTPFSIGLFGLLLSPERGILVFFPALLLLRIPRGSETPAWRSLTVLAGALLLFSILFHATFWTWHGGWTAGPRFVLPGLALLIAPLAAELTEWRERSLGWRRSAVCFLAWGLALSTLYASRAPMPRWQEVWGFHQEENQWLFMPQLSLWHAWLEGYAPPAGIVARAAMMFLWIALGGIFLRGGELREFLRSAFPLSGIRLAAAVTLAVLLTIAGALRGPRGWKETATGRTVTFLPADSAGEWRTLIDQRLNTPVQISGRANALYRVTADDALVFEETKPIPQHLPRASLPLDRGIHELAANVTAKPDEPVLFQLYWTWGGGGRYLQPVGGEYAFPRLLSPMESFATKIWRARWLLIAAGMALLLLYRPSEFNRTSSGEENP